MNSVNPVDKLVVLNFRTKKAPSYLIEWCKNAPVAMAESCDRQVWFGTRNTFGDCPVNIHRYGSEGEEAYLFMLRLMTGLDSKNPGEPNITGQVKKGWQQFEKSYPDEAKKLGRVWQNLLADNKRIRAGFCNRLKTHRHEVAARYLSGQKAGEHALLAGSLGRGDNMARFTESMARTLANKRSACVTRITVTNPDPETTAKLFEGLEYLKSRKLIACEIGKADFREIEKSLEEADRAFIDIPMDSDPQNEQKIINAWNNRTRSDNTITHLRGNPQNRGLSGPLWQNAGLENYISPEDIRSEMARIAINNKSVIQEAEIACKLRTQYRAGHGSPKLAGSHDSRVQATLTI